MAPKASLVQGFHNETVNELNVDFLLENVKLIIALQGEDKLKKSEIIQSVAARAEENETEAFLSFAPIGEEDCISLFFPEAQVLLINEDFFDASLFKSSGAFIKNFSIDEYNSYTDYCNARDGATPWSAQKDFHWSIGENYLGALINCENNFRNLIGSCIDDDTFQPFLQLISKNVFHKNREQKANGFTYHTSITTLNEKGFETLGNDLLSNCKTIVSLKGFDGSGKELALQKLLETAEELHLRVVAFHDPLLPDALEMLWIQDSDTVVVSSKKYFNFKDRKYTEYNLNELLNKVSYLKNEEELKTLNKWKDSFFDLVIQRFKTAESFNANIEESKAQHRASHSTESLLERITNLIFSN